MTQMFCPPESGPPHVGSVMNTLTLMRFSNPLVDSYNRAAVGRNSQFHSLTHAQREQLGGLEYRALTLLAIGGAAAAATAPTRTKWLLVYTKGDVPGRCIDRLTLSYQANGAGWERVALSFKVPTSEWQQRACAPTKSARDSSFGLR